MGWLWDWFWTILWNMLVHVIYLQWSEVRGDLDDLTDWWKALWREVEELVDSLEDWARGEISYWSGYAYGLYVQLVDYIGDIAEPIWDTIWAQADAIYQWARSELDWLIDLAYDLYYQAVSDAWAFASAVYDWASPYIDSVKWWVYDQFSWILGYYDLIVNWLAWVRGGLDWLYWEATAQLQAFFSDPLGYVLGWLRSSFEYWMNQLEQYGYAIVDFLLYDLPVVRNLLGVGYSFLMTFIDRPAETILELIAPTVVDWLAGVIADEW